MKRKSWFLSCLVLAALMYTGCGGSGTDISGEPAAPTPVQSAAATEGLPVEKTLTTEEETDMKTMRLMIDDTEVSVQWENNASVTALRGLAETGPKEIRMSMYGGFEQVGSLGQSLVRSDSQTVTGPGDIVLYAGNSIVVFYGSNSWAYTRLGKITDKTQQELTELLGNGDVTLTLSLEG